MTIERTLSRSDPASAPDLLMRRFRPAAAWAREGLLGLAATDQPVYRCATVEIQI